MVDGLLRVWVISILFDIYVGLICNMESASHPSLRRRKVMQAGNTRGVNTTYTTTQKQIKKHTQTNTETQKTNKTTKNIKLIKG